MRLFLRSHLSLFFITFIQGIFVFGYYWFLGFQELDHLLYVFFIQILSICLYLVYRWIQDAQLYRWVQEHQNEKLHIPHMGKSAFSESFYERLRIITQLYENKVHQVQSDLNERITFINQWVHQMKTPLSVIHLLIQEHDEEVFQDIRKELYRLEDGFKTVLYSSRLSLFEKDYTIEKIPLQAFMDEIIMENKRLFIQYKIYPKKMFPKETLFVFSDKKWLQFAIGQIISNAVKYSSNKSNKLLFKIEKQGQHIMLEIQDFGVGIPSQDMRRVFDPYFTGKNGRLYHESTGMGLYLVKNIMSKLQHEIELESEVGNGTTFKIYFSKYISE
ncbi:sensor histidine kinase [Neobacillus thermocopriae]|uniref:histidine kinase n=1 Tax=Neobacillus thermocopriae TaxID=1215031 RepID=A0A6B3TQP0_9BACI|nr:sensor histidine kinase [Neobacillus thermocopriae]MED3624643.1 sensor histidine kinase [Neobacillus thermocopriae]MED3715654.1 sensor histidine kinase [Neobacillus thermocopriae]NEX78716.1 HAMP domain-containing histidine kinase [Neobacillus thermocopriae]